MICSIIYTEGKELDYIRFIKKNIAIYKYYKILGIQLFFIEIADIILLDSY